MAGQGGLAEQVRTGLDLQPIKTKVKQEINPLDELWFNKPVRQHVREFACVLGIIFLVVAGFQARKYRLDVVFALFGLTFTMLACGYLFPQLLRPVWYAFLKIGEKLGLVVTFLVVSLAWITVVLPIAFLLKAIGKKVMVMEFKNNSQSYWEPRDAKYDDFKLLERQF